MNRRWIMALAILLTAPALADQGDKPYLLRFVDYDTLRPVTNAEVVLKPRRIILKVGPDYAGGDPNLKFARSLATDTNGICHLSRDMADMLSSEGKVYVDCRIEGYPHFVLRRHQPRPNYLPFYAITLFNRNDCLMYRVTISWLEPTVLLLQPKKKEERAPNKTNGE